MYVTYGNIERYSAMECRIITCLKSMHLVELAELCSDRSTEADRRVAITTDAHGAQDALIW